METSRKRLHFPYIAVASCFTRQSKTKQVLLTLLLCIAIALCSCFYHGAILTFEHDVTELPAWDPEVLRKRLSDLKSTRGGYSGTHAGSLGVDLHLICFDNRLLPESKFMLATAAFQGLAPVVLGIGEQNITWGPRLCRKLHNFRDFAQRRSVSDFDVILAADTQDVLILGREAEIKQGFFALEANSGKSIIFNSEDHGHCPTGDLQRGTKFDVSCLNSGVFIGRAWAIRKMLNSIVPGTGSDPCSETWLSEYVIKNHIERRSVNDQDWVREYAHAHPTEIALDTGASLLAVLYDDKRAVAVPGEDRFLLVAGERRGSQGVADGALQS